MIPGLCRSRAVSVLAAKFFLINRACQQKHEACLSTHDYETEQYYIDVNASAKHVSSATQFHCLRAAAVVMIAQPVIPAVMAANILIRLSALMYWSASLAFPCAHVLVGLHNCNLAKHVTYYEVPPLPGPGQ